MAEIYSFRPDARSYFYAYLGCTRFGRPVSLSMERNSMALDVFFVFDCDRVNSQIGVSIVPDHHLARLPDAVVPHVVTSLSLRESFAVYIDPRPFLSRIISDKDEVRNSPLFQAVDMQVSAVSVAKKLAPTIFQRKLTAGIDHRHSLIRHFQRVRRIRDAASLIGDQLPKFIARRNHP